MNKAIVVALIGLGVAARIAPHPWNFTPLMAIALYAGYTSLRWRAAVLLPMLALLISDAVLGFYSGMWVVYAASLLPVLLGRMIRNGGIPAIAGAALVSSVTFFVVTNAAVWASLNIYPHTFAGLTECFVAAIPFYRNEIAGDAFYTVAIFGVDALLQRKFHPTPQAA